MMNKQEAEQALNKHPKRVLRQLKKQRKGRAYRFLPDEAKAQIDRLIEELENR